MNHRQRPIVKLKLWMWASFAVVAGLLILILTIRNRAAAADYSALDSSSLLQRIQNEVSLENRLAAAAALGKSRDGSPWIILILLDQRFLDDPSNLVPPGMASHLRPFSDAIVARMIENIPAEANSAVLYALTVRLSDLGIGTYSEVVSTDPLNITSKRVDKHTKPIRDLAREILIRALKVDHGYDDSKWREEIANKAKSSHP